jgi:hypothetical protein
MNENPSQQITIAAGATGALVGSKVYGYVIQASGANVSIAFHKDDASGAVIWTDVLVAADLAKAHSFAKPLGRQGTGKLWCVVTGASGSADVQFD